jgi:hypothetical protein
MALQKINIKPGINRENTRYNSEGGWWECDKIRFRAGTPEKIGGWQAVGAGTFLGVCRHLFNWVTTVAQNLLAVGTNVKMYIGYGGAYFDVTPLRRSAVGLSNPFTTVNLSTLITVTDVAHGATAGDYVMFSGATGFNGITAGQLNVETTVVTVLTTDTYTIIAAAAANAGSSGGGTVTAEYQIPVGAALAATGTGWGIGTWGGTQAWGTPATGFAGVNYLLRLWSSTNFGKDLIFGPRDGGLYYWTSPDPFTTAIRAVELNTITNASDTPTVARGIFIGPDHSIVVLGANPLGSSTQDKMLIRWSAAEQPAFFTPQATNTAGDYRLERGSQIVAGLKSKQEILIWTDTALFAMQFVGPPVVYSIQPISEEISIISPNCVVAANNVVYWMGLNKFHIYTGKVDTLPSTVRSYVFDGLNASQSDQVFAMELAEFSEVWWFYPSLNSTTVDSYVSFNYLENVWATGTLARTAWIDAGISAYPLAAGYDNKLYNHEIGVDDGSTVPVTAIEAYIESADFDIGDGDEFMFVERIIPDIDFSGSEAAVPSLTLSMKARNAPGGQFMSQDDRSVTRTATVPVDQYTKECWVRIRGRQMSFKIASTDVGVTWQSGHPRIGLRSDGRR